MRSMPPRFFENDVISVLLIGAGGNGSECFDGLIKIHLALQAFGHPGLHLTVFDNDVVAGHNIVRQRYWPQEIGLNKAVALVHRTNMLLGTNWDAYPILFDKSSAHILRKAIVVVTAVDRLSSRQSLLQARIPGDRLWIDLGVDGRQGQFVIGDLMSDSLSDALPNCVAYYPEIATGIDAHAAPSCSAAESLSRQDLFVNSACAQFAMELLWHGLRKGYLPYSGGIIDLESGHKTPMPFLPRVQRSDDPDGECELDE